MQQLGFESYDQVKSAADLSAQKDEIERKKLIFIIRTIKVMK